MDGGGRSRREHAIESNATTRVVYGQSNCRVRTFFGRQTVRTAYPTTIRYSDSRGSLPTAEDSFYGNSEANIELIWESHRAVKPMICLIK
jgi:hypothetical protein